MTAPTNRLTMPYPGLRPFEEADHPLFFGREAQVNDLLRQLEDSPFVAVVGASGSGKSSLVRAGLLPAIREGFLFGTPDWRIAVIKPGHEPYQRLARELAGYSPTTEEQELRKTLRRSDRGLLAAVDAAGIGPQTHVLVVIDQFEELFAFRRASAGQDNVASRDEAAAFVAMLVRTGADPANRVRIVLTMRSDFIGDCEAFLGLPEAVSRSQFLVARLNRSQMEAAIVCPGQIRGAGFERFMFEEGLVNRISNDAGDRPDQLPLMQHALMRTWKLAIARAGDGLLQLAHGDYETAGGIEEALSKHADAAWDEIKDDPGLAHIARRMFLLLCDVSPDGQISRRRPRVSEVMEVAGAKLEEVKAVVRAFQRDDRNFLLPPAPEPLTEDTVLDVSHEALLRRWELFANEWLNQEREDAAELRRLAELADLHRRGEGGLIPPRDLGRLCKWKKRVSPEWSRRYISEAAWTESTAFFAASRSRAKQMIVLVLGVALLLLWTTAGSILMWIRASKAESRAKAAQANVETALVNSFVRTIGVSDGASSSLEERAALWDLAELDIANTAAVREQLLDQWFQSQDFFEKANRRGGLGLRAVGELNPAVRQHIEARASELTQSLATERENAGPSSALDVNLICLAYLLKPADAARMADGLATAMEKETELRVLSHQSDFLAALTGRLEPADSARLAARGAVRLAAAMEEETDVYLFDSTMHRSFFSLARRLEPADAARLAARVADRLAAAMEKETDIDRFMCRSDSLEALTGRLEPSDAKRLAARASDRLATAMQKETDAYRLYYMGHSLAKLTQRLEPADAARLAARGAAGLAAAMEKETDEERLPQLSDSLAVVARLKAAGAAGLAAEVEKVTDEGRLSQLGNSLALLARRLEPADAARLAARGADRLAAAMEKETDIDRFMRLRDCLAALAERLEPADTARRAKRLAMAMENEIDATQLVRLRHSLAALAGRLEPADAARLADRLATAMEKETDAPGLGSLCYSLAALAGRLEPEDAARLARRSTDRLATAMEKETDANRLTVLRYSLPALTGRLEPADAARLAARCAERLATAMEKETDAERLSILSVSLAALAERLDPADHQMRHFALSYLLLDPIRGPPRDGEEEDKGRKRVAALCQPLSKGELVEVLKWPFCVRAAENIVLAELERKLTEEFERPIAFRGDPGKLVEQAPSLGITNHATPAHRPRLEDVQKELATIRERLGVQ